MNTRFKTRFDTMHYKGQLFEPVDDLVDTEGFLPLHLRLSKIDISTALSKAYNTGLNEGYKRYLQSLEGVEGDESIIHELSISRYDDLELQKAYIRGYENARSLVGVENRGSDFSETYQTSNATPTNTPDNGSEETGGQ